MQEKRGNKLSLTIDEDNQLRKMFEKTYDHGSRDRAVQKNNELGSTKFKKTGYQER